MPIATCATFPRMGSPEIIDMKAWLARQRDKQIAHVIRETQAINELCDEIEAVLKRLSWLSKNKP